MRNLYHINSRVHKGEDKQCSDHETVDFADGSDGVKDTEVFPFGVDEI